MRDAILLLSHPPSQHRTENTLNRDSYFYEITDYTKQCLIPDYQRLYFTFIFSFIITPAFISVKKQISLIFRARVSVQKLETGKKLCCKGKSYGLTCFTPICG